MAGIVAGHNVEGHFEGLLSGKRCGYTLPQRLVTKFMQGDQTILQVFRRTGEEGVAFDVPAPEEECELR